MKKKNSKSKTRTKAKNIGNKRRNDKNGRVRVRIILYNSMKMRHLRWRSVSLRTNCFHILALREK